MKIFNFSSKLEKMNSDLWQYHFLVPDKVFETILFPKKDKRVVCTINNQIEFQCALLPKKGEGHMILLNQKYRKKLNLEIGDTLNASIRLDDSEFGLPMPQELEIALAQDEIGAELFFKLTDGKKRTLLYWCANVKNMDLRIKRAWIIMDCLKMNAGVPDFKIMNNLLKERK